MLNEGPGVAAQQGKGGDLPHQTVTPVSPHPPSFLHVKMLESHCPYELRKTTEIKHHSIIITSQTVITFL